MTEPSEPVIHASGIEKTFNGSLTVRGISFSVAKGQCFGVLGPNGAGKTTTLRLILGISPLSAGDLRVFGLTMPKFGDVARERIGVVPQIDSLDPDFNVFENLRMYGRYFDLNAKLVEERASALLKLMELGEKANAKPATLSGGMRRRLTIARALINNPDLLVLDEPTTGLDPQARHLIWARLRQLVSEGKTLLLTTHYMEEAERLCDELVIMDQGKILDQGSPMAIIGRHVEKEVLEIRGEDLANCYALNTEQGCRLETVDNSLYCYTNDARPMITRLKDCADVTYLHRPANLEDVFLKLTGRELRD